MIVGSSGARINVTEDGFEVDSTHLGFTTSPHEECAVEEAVQIAEVHDGEVTVITLGPEAAEEQLRYAASVGVNNLVLLPIDEVDWDPQRTADALTKAITEIEISEGAFDLILFGNESADSGGFQVGIRVSHQLGRPIVNGIKNIEKKCVGISPNVTVKIKQIPDKLKIIIKLFEYSIYSFKL